MTLQCEVLPWVYVYNDFNHGHLISSVSCAFPTPWNHFLCGD